MSSLPQPGHATPEEYLEFDRNSQFRYEFVDGEIVLMSGGTSTHGLICSNLNHSLQGLLGDRCVVFVSDMRLCVAKGDLITYPDISVFCNRPVYLDARKDTLTNPTFLAEVLSPSTRRFDLGEKSRYYRSIPSLKEYMLVEQDRTEVTLYHRVGEDHWDLITVRDPEVVIRLDALDCTIPIAAIYRGLDRL